MILTSNRTRELHDALQAPLPVPLDRHPTLDREVAIVRARVPGVPERLAAQAARFVAELRALELAKSPGVAETMDWVQALVALGEAELEPDVVDATLGTVLKYHEDLERVRDARARTSSSRAAGAPTSDEPRARGGASSASWRHFGRVLR